MAGERAGRGPALLGDGPPALSKPAAEGQGIAGVRDGLWTFWYETGQPERRGTFRASRRHGPWTLWYEDGQKRAEGTYENGQRVGEWKLWQRTGELTVRNSGVDDQ